MGLGDTCEKQGQDTVHTATKFKNMLLLASQTCPQKTIQPSDTCGSVLIFHPKLPDGPPFLKFEAFTSKPDGNALGGVPLGFVFDTCYVVARNKKGQLRRCAQPLELVEDSDDPNDPDDSNKDKLLMPGEYLFIVVEDGG